MNNANEIRFRASGFHHLDVEPKKGELIAKGTQTHLVDVFASAKYGRHEEITGKYLDKGNECEEDAITALSRVTKRLFKKNDVRLTNDWITGEPDVFIGESIEKADETIDTKTSWSLHTFLRAKHKPLEKAYYWQGQCYMMLTGAKKHTVAYCLVNGTAKAIMDEKRVLSYSYDIIDTEPQEYVDKCKQIEINHIFDLGLFRKHNPFFEFHNDVNKWTYDIPLADRVFTFLVERDEEAIESIKVRCESARKWMDKHLFKTELNEMLPDQKFIDQAKEMPEPKPDCSSKIEQGKKLQKLVKTTTI